MSTEFVKGGGSKLAIRMASPGEYLVTGFTPTVVTDKIYELPFTTEAFNPSGEFINSNAIAGGRSRGIGCIGNRVGDGNFDTEVTIGNFLYLMYAALGKVAGLEDVSYGDYVLSHSPDAMPEYDVYIRHGATDESLIKFEGAVVNTLRLSFSSNTFLTASIDWSGKKRAADSYVTEVDAVAKGDIIRGSTGDIYICKTAIATYITETHYPEDGTAWSDSWVKGFSGTDFTAFTSAQAFICPIKIGTSILLSNSGSSLSSYNILPFTTALELTISNGLDTDTNALDASGRLAILSGELSITGSLTLLIPKHTSGTDVNLDNFNELLASLDVGDLLAGRLSVYLYKEEILGVGDQNKEFYELDLHNVYATQPVHDVTERGKVAYRVDFQCVTDPTRVAETLALLDEPLVVRYWEDTTDPANKMYFPITYAPA
jgi:hypothetical protein